MAKERQPGDFILDTATCGQELTSSLLFLFPSSRARDIAAHISISVTTLNEVGNAVNNNAGYFKDTFESKFETVLTKFKEKFDIIRAACEKATSSRSSDNVVKSLQGPFKKLIWAFGMTKEEFNVFSRSLDDCYRPALLLRTLVNLIVLQIIGQNRELTPAEQTLLYRCKLEIPELLATLRELEIGAVISFSLADTSKPVNVAQIEDAALAGSRVTDSDDASGTTIAATACDKCNENTSISQTDGKGQAPTNGRLANTKKEPDKEVITFEMHKLTYRITSAQQTQSSWSLFNVPFKKKCEENSAWQMDRIHISQDDLKSFIEKQKSNNANYETGKINSLLNPPAACSGLLYQLINSKNHETNFRAHFWFLECLVSTKEEKKSRAFWRERGVQPDSYIVIIRCESGSYPTSGHLPPFRRPPHRGPPPPGWPHPPVIVIDKEGKRDKKVTKITLTQREAEIVINDFLASFSTLYDGIPVEMRGIKLREIDLNSGYNSDNTASTSTGSCSLADD